MSCSSQFQGWVPRGRQEGMRKAGWMLGLWREGLSQVASQKYLVCAALLNLEALSASRTIPGPNVPPLRPAPCHLELRDPVSFHLLPLPLHSS
jgi:hypothetical protein